MGRGGVTNFCMLLVGAVNDGGAADFRYFLPVPVERPAADLLATNHILHEQNASVEP